MIPADRLQQLIKGKNAVQSREWCERHGYCEGWAIIDGTLVIYDVDGPPAWLTHVRGLLDDDGNTVVERPAD